MPTNENPRPTQYYDKDPYPLVETGVIVAGQEQPIVYDNGNEEVSEIQQIMVKAPPLVQVKVMRTEDNQEQTVTNSVYVRDLDTDDAGNPTLYFRWSSRDKPLTTRKKQTLRVILTNTYGFQVSYVVKVFKNALRFYTPREVVREASQVR